VVETLGQKATLLHIADLVTPEAAVMRIAGQKQHNNYDRIN
jgi:hypothetical protein